MSGATIPEPGQPACTWIGHCLGDQCQNQNDCDNDWICVSSICVVPPPSKSLTNGEIAVISAGVPIFAALVAGLLVFWIMRRRRRRRRLANLNDDTSTMEMWPVYEELRPGRTPRSVPIQIKRYQEMGDLPELASEETKPGELEGEPQYLPYLPPSSKDDQAPPGEWPRRTPPQLLWEEVDLGIRGWHECSSPQHRREGPRSSPGQPINFSRKLSFSARSNRSAPSALAITDSVVRDADQNEPTEEPEDEDDDALEVRDGEAYTLFSWPKIKP